jgi:hypothetical protein
LRTIAPQIPGSTGKACDAQRPEAEVKAWSFQCSLAWYYDILASASRACGTRTSYVLPIVERLSSAVHSQKQTTIEAIEDNRSTNWGSTGEACDAQRSEAEVKAW